MIVPLLLAALGLAVAASDLAPGTPVDLGSEGTGAAGFRLGPDGRIHVPGDAFVEELLESASPQVRLGADRYHLVCAACHGSSGLGQEEGRAIFPPSHQRCERCHRASNPPRSPGSVVEPRNAFSIGAPPALRGAGALGSFPDGPALLAYLRAAMPRYQPGVLDDDEYLAITAFLLAMNGRVPPATTLDELGVPADPTPGTANGFPGGSR